jgi:high-affinity K+ transport system ATPase subunit B
MILIIILPIWFICSLSNMYLFQKYAYDETFREITLSRIIICLFSGPVGFIISLIYSFDYIDFLQIRPFNKNKEK